MSNRIRKVIAASLSIAAIYAVHPAHAQAWNGTEGSSILRVSPLGIHDPFDRPGIYFIGKPAPALAPSYSFVYPFGGIRYTVDEGQLVREFYPLGKNGKETYASHIRGRRILTALHRRHH